MIDKLKELFTTAKDWLAANPYILEIHWNNAGNTESFDFRVGWPVFLIILAFVVWEVAIQ